MYLKIISTGSQAYGEPQGSEERPESVMVLEWLGGQTLGPLVLEITSKLLDSSGGESKSAHFHRGGMEFKAEKEKNIDSWLILLQH